MTKTYVIAALIILILILSLGIGRLMKDVRREKSNLRAAIGEVTLWRDAYNNAHAERELLKVTNSDLRKNFPAIYDSLKKSFGDIKPRTITNVITVTKHTADTVIFEREIACPEFSIAYDDNWNQFVFTNSGFTFSIKDSLTFVQAQKKTGFLKSKRIDVVRAISHNPKPTFTDLQAIEIESKPRNWGIGIMVGYGATNTGLSPVIAGGLYYRIF